MKCIVIYFSQTGNTEKIAYAIRSGIKQLAGHCDIVKMKDANPRRLYDYDLIGLGHPIINPLGILGIFVKNMCFVGGKHAFIFCTHGTSAGESFFPAAYPLLKRKGLTVIGRGDWYGDCYLLHEVEPYYTAGHPDEVDLKEAEDFGREMVLRSWRISAGETKLIPLEPPPPPTPELPPSFDPDNFLKILNSFSLLLKFHKEKCSYPQCRLCMDNCPVDGIDLSMNPPVLAKPCLNCEFCARLCPTGALDMNEWMEAMMQFMDTTETHTTKNRIMEKAEVEGRFRRLTPIEKVESGNFGYRLHKNHPQWIIGKGRL